MGAHKPAKSGIHKTPAYIVPTSKELKAVADNLEKFAAKAGKAQAALAGVRQYTGSDGERHMYATDGFSMFTVDKPIADMTGPGEGARTIEAADIERLTTVTSPDVVTGMPTTGEIDKAIRASGVKRADALIMIEAENGTRMIYKADRVKTAIGVTGAGGKNSYGGFEMDTAGMHALHMSNTVDGVTVHGVVLGVRAEPHNSHIVMTVKAKK